jgi:hypothetical protein
MISLLAIYATLSLPVKNQLMTVKQTTETTTDCPHRRKQSHNTTIPVLASTRVWSLDSQEFFNRALCDLLAVKKNRGLVAIAVF